MTLEEAIADLESRVSMVVNGPPQALSGTGEPYLTIVSGGEKEKGEPLPCLCRDQETAIRLWHSAAMTYFNKVQKEFLLARSKDVRLGQIIPSWTLHWRKKPELKSENHPEIVWTVWARLLISWRPLSTSTPAPMPEEIVQ